MDLNSLRSEVCLLLAEAFKQPTAEYIEDQSDIATFLAEAFSKLAYNLPPELYADLPVLAKDLATLSAKYRQSFIFPVDSRIVPVESIYRQWTRDQTADVPFAREKGLLMSDHALHMKALYDDYGFTIPAEYQSMPDHICLELEFAAFLLDQAPAERYLIFLKEHLSWLDQLATEAEKKKIPDYYRQIVKLTAQFLSSELRRCEKLI